MNYTKQVWTYPNDSIFCLTTFRGTVRTRLRKVAVIVPEIPPTLFAPNALPHLSRTNHLREMCYRGRRPTPASSSGITSVERLCAQRTPPPAERSADAPHSRYSQLRCSPDYHPLTHPHLCTSPTLVAYPLIHIQGGCLPTHQNLRWQARQMHHGQFQTEARRAAVAVRHFGLR